LEYVDLIVLKSKESGGYIANREKRVCIYRPKATMPPAVEEYLETSFRQSNADYLLYAAVNRSLDLNIELLGQERVEDGVRQFRHLQTLAQERCLSQAVFPCTANDTFQDGWQEDCYDRDWGCGYRCVDQVLDEYTLQKSKERYSKSISRPLHAFLPAMPRVGVYYGPEARLYSHRFKQ
jgi:hypothetical protein